jgi:hypothetical protein
MVLSCHKWVRGSMVAGAMVSAVAVWHLSPAGAATGGGCSKASGGGFRISSCISAHFENPLSTRIIPDYYVDAVPDLQRAKETCSIVWNLYKDNERLDRGSLGAGSCVPGHVIVQQQPNASGNYYLEVQVFTGTDPGHQNLILKADSPVQFN